MPRDPSQHQLQSKIRMATYKGDESELPKRARSVWMPGQKESQILKALAETTWGQEIIRKRERREHD